ncbi:UTRA domain-containing protein [Rubrobacter taiwanensis]|uniref:UTRA domain-containing protein n=1 Tax=Rubrobacter taiwanensis TaxID=185139 RepID=A0A4R1BRH8_9ACTN|nr:UTRA domain-containing protein [Rubrobacter taiwanensis]TCJ19927.1 UTRA domain-containing protein [Rubrobacter taiwanensis]
MRPGCIDYRVAEKMGFSESVARVGFEPCKKVLGVRRVRMYGRSADGLGVSSGALLVVLERVSYAGEIPLVYGIKYFREDLLPGICDLLRRDFRSARELVRAHYGLELYRARSVFEMEPADPEIPRCLGTPAGVGLLRVEALDVFGDGTPAEWGISYFRGDAIRVLVETRGVKGVED